MTSNNDPVSPFVDRNPLGFGVYHRKTMSRVSGGLYFLSYIALLFTVVPHIWLRVYVLPLD